MPAFNVYGAADLAELVQAFRDSEAHILRLIAQAVARGAEGTGDFYLAQYAQMTKLRREATAVLDSAYNVSYRKLARLLGANAQGAAIDALALPVTETASGIAFDDLSELVSEIMAPNVKRKHENKLAVEAVLSAAAIDSLAEDVPPDRPEIPTPPVNKKPRRKLAAGGTTGRLTAGVTQSRLTADILPKIMAPAINTEAVNRLTLETISSLESMRHSVLRSVDDIFRSVTRAVATRGVMSGETMNARLQAALNEYAAEGITAYVDRAGRHWKIDTYAEMALRTATNRAQNQGRIEQFRAHDIRLIRTSQHMGCSDLCLPYQGKILSLDGTTGTVTLVDPTDGNNVTVTITATLDDAIANGYHHPNCRHTDTAYIPGAPLPPPVPTGTAEATAEQAQRYNERQIRAWKRRDAVAITPHAKSKSTTKVRQWQARQREHLKEYPWLQRRYDREQVRAGIAANAEGLPGRVNLQEFDVTF